MAEDAQENKSKVSMITEEIGKKKIELKASIHTFSELLEERYSPNEFNGYKDTLRLNLMTGRPEWLDIMDDTWHEWTDTQDSQLRAFMQSAYGLYNPRMLDDAVTLHFERHAVNPLLQILDSLQWDGKPRVHEFLHDIMKCSDTPYYRECSRLIFAGGIWRAYRPGCKFDDMIVLIGKQGGGKSTIVRWLNIEDRFFREIKTINGKEGIEAIRGVWIGEVAELMAMTRVKEAEAVKAYITSQEDSYRPPYAKHVKTIPRRCCFIGTTNNSQFLTDKTGNRRFYPVKCNVDGYILLDNEKKVREYIRQAWAEAVHMFRENNLQPFAKKELLEDIRVEQENAMEDDWRIGAIEDYLEQTKQTHRATVSVIELWHNALKEPEESKPTRKDSIEITQIMMNIPGWVRSEKAIIVKPWGKQKVFVKSNPFFGRY